MNRWFKLAALLMLLGVVLGAFGAHAMKGRLSAGGMEIYRTGVFYHMIHALALFVIAWLADARGAGDKRVLAVGIVFTLGILFFSGSLYLLAITGIHAFGAVTPIGGVLFILGWGILLYS